MPWLEIDIPEYEAFAVANNMDLILQKLGYVTGGSSISQSAAGPEYLTVGHQYFNSQEEMERHEDEVRRNYLKSQQEPAHVEAATQ